MKQTDGCHFPHFPDLIPDAFLTFLKLENMKISISEEHMTQRTEVVSQ